jgi:alpha-1,2-mannosyltransferase
MRSRTAASCSVAGAIALAIYLAQRSYQVDLDVYLMGGQHALRPDLYTAEFGLPFLRFTYTPFAALTFAPFAHVVGIFTAQVIWSVVNIAGLFGLLLVSIRTASPELPQPVLVQYSCVCLLPALLLNPVFLTVGLGQINLILCVAVLWDLMGSRRLGRFELPLGVLTGVAAAIKLTPLIFLVFLAGTKRLRGAVTGAGTFVVCSAVAYLLAPSASHDYWTQYIFEPRRAGALLYSSDQNLASALERFHHAPISPITLDVTTLAVGVVGLVLSVLIHRHRSPLFGLLVCAATGLLISPITWTHHLVWIVPALAWLELAPDGPRHGKAWAAAVAILFWAAPIWWVPTSWRPSGHPEELGEQGWRLIAGNSFFLALVVFLSAAAIALIRIDRVGALDGVLRTRPRPSSDVETSRLFERS